MREGQKADLATSRYMLAIPDVRESRKFNFSAFPLPEVLLARK